MSEKERRSIEPVSSHTERRSTCIMHSYIYICIYKCLYNLYRMYRGNTHDTYTLQARARGFSHTVLSRLVSLSLIFFSVFSFSRFSLTTPSYQCAHIQMCVRIYIYIFSRPHFVPRSLGTIEVSAEGAQHLACTLCSLSFFFSLSLSLSLSLWLTDRAEHVCATS
uniref:Uncharacterized protein n=1 Tax=Glypta fumiferanae TaxID=389681 RepID=A0A0F6Q8E8_9HYME|nr:hypothetical protein [Glypta fumiferanae]